MTDNNNNSMYSICHFDLNHNLIIIIIISNNFQKKCQMTREEAHRECQCLERRLDQERRYQNWDVLVLSCWNKYVQCFIFEYRNTKYMLQPACLYKLIVLYVTE